MRQDEGLADRTAADVAPGLGGGPGVGGSR